MKFDQEGNPKGLRFEEVLPALKAGKKVRRESWCITVYFKLGDDGSGWMTVRDFLADDWEVVKEKVKRTVWVNVSTTGCGEIFIGAGHWNSQSKAMEHASNEYTYLGAHPVTAEVDE